jgi:putative addiction module CopG family antidote
MRSTQQFSITLPHEMAEAVRAKVAAGEYATESEVIRDGLRALLARDRAVERWLRKDVAAAVDKLQADPLRAVTVGAVKARLAAAHARLTQPAAGQAPRSPTRKTARKD